MKPARLSEHASLKQFQLIAHNSCSAHAQLMLAIKFLCDVNDMRALIGRCYLVTPRLCQISDLWHESSPSLLLI